MNDMASTITAKSDQLNADDLMGGPITIKITDTRVMMAEQPCIINFEGDNGKPWKPGKSMRRVIVAAWGTDPSVYKGRSLTLYREPDVMFGGVRVGGTRISHMSHLTTPLTVSLTVTRGSKKPFVVKPLQVQASSNPTADDPAEIARLQSAAKKAAKGGSESLKAHWTTLGGPNQKKIGGAPFLEELKIIAAAAAPAQDSSAPQTSSADDEVPFDV